jgi:hypothetical protein
MVTASQGLWKKFRAAQSTKNEDAALAYRRAIEHADKGKAEDAAWWERQGDMAMPVATEKEEHASR